MKGNFLLAFLLACLKGKGLLIYQVHSEFARGVCEEGMGFSEIIREGVFSLWGHNPYFL